MFIHHNLLQIYPKYMHLRVFVSDPELYDKYYEAIYNHNSNLNNNPVHIDAGFDLYSPYNEFVCTSDNVCKLDFKVKCSAQIVEKNTNGQICSYNTGYYMHPRSSIYKTPLRLANSTGIVDSGYRGNLIGAPGLIPIYVELVDKSEDLGADTIRGERGFGSSGR